MFFFFKLYVRSGDLLQTLKLNPDGETVPHNISKTGKQTAYQQLSIIDSCMHLLSPSLLLLLFHSVLPTPFPLLIIPQQKDGAHQTHRGKSWPWHRLIVAPASGNPDRACARWQWQERQDACRFSDRKNGEDELSAKEVLILLLAWEAFLASTFRSYHIFSTRLASSQKQNSHRPLVYTSVRQCFCNDCSIKEQHWRHCKHSCSPISPCNIVGVGVFVYARVRDIMVWIKGRWFV